MTSNYAQYIKEREDKDIIEYDYGFATYKIDNEYIYLADVYVQPKYRKDRKAMQFVNEVADIGRELNCKYMVTTYDVNANEAKASKEVIKRCGFKFFKIDNTLIWYKKEI